MLSIIHKCTNFVVGEEYHTLFYGPRSRGKLYNEIIDYYIQKIARKNR